MKKRILSVFLAALMTLAVLPALTTVSDGSEFSSGYELKSVGAWHYLRNSEESVIVRYTHKDTRKVTIPSSLGGGFPVRVIYGKYYKMDSIFKENAVVEHVTIPDSVWWIGDRSFKNCKALKTVSLGKGVSLIDSQAFFGCESLKEITFPDSLKTISFSAFYGCKSLESIEFPVGLTTIDNRAFNKCVSLTSVVIPDTVTTLGGAFSDCTSLTNVTLGNGLNEISQVTFQKCSSLKSITVPASVTLIDRAAFNSCESLETVYYGGTSEQWNAVEIDNDMDYNKNLYSATVYFNHPAHSMTYVPTTATCIAGGTAGYYHCSLCGKDFLDEAGNDLFTGQTVSALGHEVGEWTVTFPATCTGAGVETQFCARCGDLLQTREVPALGHDYKPVSTTAPNCTEPGTVTYACSRCGDSYTDEGQTEPIHFFGDWTLTTEPTCFAQGEETRYCARCGASETRPVEPTEHNYTAWTVVTWETCTTDGEETRRCTVCGSVETRILPATGHSFVGGYCEYCCDDDPTSPKFIVSDAWSKTRGDQVELTVSIVNNPGVSSLILGLSYDDSTFILDDVENGELFDEIADFNPWDGLGSVCFDSDSFVTGDGVLMTMTFTVTDWAVTEWYDVGVYVRGAALDENGDEIDFLWFAGNVAVIVYGDVNDDGNITGMDASLVLQYAANYDDETGESSVDIPLVCADVNGDGKITVIDASLILQYVANYDDETGTSTVVLGPTL